MKYPINFAGTYPKPWAGYYFREPLGYTSGVHTGVDFNGAGAGNADLGLPIVAICGGTVVDKRSNGQIKGFGNCLIIESSCPPNINGSKLYHRYLHMNSIEVAVGQQVVEGQRIGTVGNTGTEYAHLHLDTWTNRNGLGPHWNYDKDTALASYEDPYRVIENNQSWSGNPSGNGGSVAETINDDVSRQIGWHYLGRNGFDGKPNALQAKQGDIFGQPLTNAKLSEFFLSAEAREWRDSRIHKVYGERDALRTTNGNLNSQITQLTKDVAEKQKTIETQSQSINELNQVVAGQKLEISELNEQVKRLTAENIALKKQLEEAGSTPPATPETDTVTISKDSVWTAFVNWVNKVFGGK